MRLRRMSMLHCNISRGITIVRGKPGTKDELQLGRGTVGLANRLVVRVGADNHCMRKRLTTLDFIEVSEIA